MKKITTSIVIISMLFQKNLVFSQEAVPSQKQTIINNNIAIQSAFNDPEFVVKVNKMKNEYIYYSKGSDLESILKLLKVEKGIIAVIIAYFEYVNEFFDPIRVWNQLGIFLTMFKYVSQYNIREMASILSTLQKKQIIKNQEDFEQISKYLFKIENVYALKNLISELEIIEKALVEQNLKVSDEYIYAFFELKVLLESNYDMAHLFKKNLPLFIKEGLIKTPNDFRKIGKQLLNLERYAGYRNHLKEDLVAILRLLKIQNLELSQYWDEIVALQKNYRVVLQIIIKDLVKSPDDLRKVAKKLIEIQSIYEDAFVDTEAIFEKYKLNFTQYWNEFSTLLLKIGIDMKRFLNEILPKLFEKYGKENILNNLESFTINMPYLADFLDRVLPMLANNPENMINVLKVVKNFYDDPEMDVIVVLESIFNQTQTGRIKSKLLTSKNKEQCKKILKLFFEGVITFSDLEEMSLFIENSLETEDFQNRVLELKTKEDILQLFPNLGLENKEQDLIRLISYEGFLNLTDEEKIIAILSTLFSDIAQNKNPLESAELAEQVLLKLYVLNKINRKIFRSVISQIEFQNWSEYITKDEIEVKASLRLFDISKPLSWQEIIAGVFKEKSDWRIAKILAELNLGEGNKEELLANTKLVDSVLQDIHNHKIWFPQSSIASEDIDFNYIVPFLRKKFAGFAHAIKTMDLLVNLQIFKRCGLSIDPFNSLLSVSWWHDGNFNTYQGMENGLILSVSSMMDIITAMNFDIATGAKKNLFFLISYLSTKEDRRVYYSQKLRKYFEIKNDREYEDLFSILERYKTLEDIPEDLEFNGFNIKKRMSKMLIKRLLSATPKYEDCFSDKEVGVQHNEMIVQAPLLGAVFHKGTIKNIPVILKYFARLLCVPIYVFPNPEIEDIVRDFFNNFLNDFLNDFLQKIEQEGLRDYAQMLLLNKKMSNCA